MHSPVVHVVGARPNFMKAAPVIRSLQDRQIDQRLVHTGQHYDPRLSDVFFRDLALPEPDLDLGVGSGSPRRPDRGAARRPRAGLRRPRSGARRGLRRRQLDACRGAGGGEDRPIPSAHVEAGLRSFDRTMPEEVNRVVTDALSDLLFATSPEAVPQLVREGVAAERIHFVGNPMIDTLLGELDRLDPAAARAALGLGPTSRTRWRRSTVRPTSTSRPRRGAHRGRRARRRRPAAHRDPAPSARPGDAGGRPGCAPPGRIRIVEPMGYRDFLSLVRGARLVVTDFGRHPGGDDDPRHSRA